MRSKRISLRTYIRADISKICSMKGREKEKRRIDYLIEKQFIVELQAVESIDMKLG